MAISFMSEHTAEYVLVPEIVNALRTNYRKVIPFYFWSTREGNSTSRMCNPQAEVSLVAAFPRRPKITSPDQDTLLVKFNKQLFSAATVAIEFAIPVFAGVPLATSLLSLSPETKCSWFRIPASKSEPLDVELHIGIDGNLLSNQARATAVEGPLSIKKLVQDVIKLTGPTTWAKSIDNLRQMRQSLSSFPGYSPGPFLSPYKPFYLLLQG